MLSLITIGLCRLLHRDAASAFSLNLHSLLHRPLEISVPPGTVVKRKGTGTLLGELLNGGMHVLCCARPIHLWHAFLPFRMFTYLWSVCHT